MKSLKSQVFFGLTCFALGIGAVLLGQRIVAHKSEPPSPPRLAMKNLDPIWDQFYNDDFFGRSHDPFEQMQKMRKLMMKDFDQPEEGGSGMFDSWYRNKFGGGDAGEIKKREDKQFIYYDVAIKDLDKESLSAKVADGQINISGKIERKPDQLGGTYFSSTFHRSFPIPRDADPNSVQMEHSKDQLTIKFKRLPT